MNSMKYNGKIKSTMTLIKSNNKNKLRKISMITQIKNS